MPEADCSKQENRCFYHKDKCHSTKGFLPEGAVFRLESSRHPSYSPPRPPIPIPHSDTGTMAITANSTGEDLLLDIRALLKMMVDSTPPSLARWNVSFLLDYITFPGYRNPFEVHLGGTELMVKIDHVGHQRTLVRIAEAYRNGPWSPVPRIFETIQLHAPLQDFAAVVMEKLTNFRYDNEHIETNFLLATRQLQKIHRVPDAEGYPVCHGDVHFGNLKMSAQGIPKFVDLRLPPKNWALEQRKTLCRYDQMNLSHELVKLVYCDAVVDAIFQDPEVQRYLAWGLAHPALAVFYRKIVNLSYSRTFYNVSTIGTLNSAWAYRDFHIEHCSMLHKAKEHIQRRRGDALQSKAKDPRCKAKIAHFLALFGHGIDTLPPENDVILRHTAPWPEECHPWYQASPGATTTPSAIFDHARQVFLEQLAAKWSLGAFLKYILDTAEIIYSEQVGRGGI